MYTAQVTQLLDDLEASHAHYYHSEGFGGPSLYFHGCALRDGAARDLKAFTVSSYAMLASWGMHRMGRGGAKMADFKVYEDSLLSVWHLIIALQKQDGRFFQEGDWAVLREAFFGIKAMRSKFSLVANSKVLAHVLPNLIPPVDRQYTIPFLHGRRTLPQDIEGEWELLRRFLECFFYPILNHQTFEAAYIGWTQADKDFAWNTSPLKTLDNVLVGHMRSKASAAKR